MSYDKTKWIQITVPVTEPEHERIKAAAAADSRSMAAFIRLSVIAHLDPPRPPKPRP